MDMYLRDKVCFELVGSGLTRSINITAAAAAALQVLENIFPGKDGVGKPRCDQRDNDDRQRRLIHSSGFAVRPRPRPSELQLIMPFLGPRDTTTTNQSDKLEVSLALRTRPVERARVDRK